MNISTYHTPTCKTMCKGQPNSSPCKRNTTKKKSVTFSESSTVYIVANISTHPYKQSIWFTKDELDRIKSIMPHFVHRVQLQLCNRATPSVADTLGIERLLSPWLRDEHRTRRRILKKKVVQWHKRLSLVQERCYEDGEDYDAVDKLAKISIASSSWARERARAIALNLAQSEELERHRQALNAHQLNTAHSSDTLSPCNDSHRVFPRVVTPPNVFIP